MDLAGWALRSVGRVVAGPRPRTAVCAGVSSADQVNLDRQVARGGCVDHGPADPDRRRRNRGRLNGQRRTFLGLLGDPSVEQVVAEHRDRFCRFGSEHVQAALKITHSQRQNGR